MHNNQTHGHSPKGRWTPTYYSWAAMLSRCSNPARNNYHNYGGRGIRVCRRWLNFANFLEDMGERPEKTSIGRLDANRDYKPGNCAWHTRTEQARDRRNNKLTLKKAATIKRMYTGGEGTQRELGARFGVSHTMIRNVVRGRAWA